MADILQFPNGDNKTDAEQVAKLELRLQEIATEGEYITDDIIYLQEMREKGKNEAEQIIKKLAHLNAKGAQTELLDKIVDDFVGERGLTDAQEPQTDTATEKWEDLADKTLDTSLTLLEEAIKKLKDDFNNDKPKDK